MAKVIPIETLAIEQYETGCDKLVDSFFSYEANCTDLPRSNRIGQLYNIEDLLETSRNYFNKLPTDLQMKFGDYYAKLYDKVFSRLKKDIKDIGDDDLVS